MKNKFKIFEHFIFLAIILVIIQTFLDNFSLYSGWPVKIRHILLYSGFAFDLIFTIEFVSRSIYNGKNKKFKEYFWYNRGWIDLLSSVPLLLFDSGFSIYLLQTGDMYELAAASSAVIGIGGLNVLKVIKAIRVTRILRLIRVIKIFGKIHNTDSKMAQHHTATITTIAVFSIIATLIIFSTIFPSSNNRAIDNRISYYSKLMKNIQDIDQFNETYFEQTKSLLIKDKNILFLTYKSKEVIRLNKTHFEERYTHDDFKILTPKNSEFKAYISILDINSELALVHIQSFVLIIVIVLAFTLLYTKHFAQSISDVIHILNLGFRKKDYNLQIKINKHYKDHEVYRLAKFYNDAYLPAKIKKSQKEKSSGGKGLSIKDLMNFNK